MTDVLKNQQVKNNNANDEDAKIQQAIKNYLLKNPDYFIQHPELMGELEVTSTKGKLTDLSTHQLRTLQRENRQFKTQISQLVKNAQQSESMMNRLFNLLTELSVVEKHEYLPKFVNFVIENFPADYFKLLLADGLLELPVHEHVAKLSVAQMEHFAVFQVKPEPLSGRLQQEKIHSIFNDSQGIKSAIVLPVGIGAEYGLLAFASKDEEKFHPNSSSDLLQKLAHVLVVYLMQVKPKAVGQ